MTYSPNFFSCPPETKDYKHKSRFPSRLCFHRLRLHLVNNFIYRIEKIISLLTACWNFKISHFLITHELAYQSTTSLLMNLGFWVLFVFFLNLFYWSIVDLQCCINFYWTAKWFRYTYLSIYIYRYIYTYSFSYSFPLWFITGYWI